MKRLLIALFCLLLSGTITAQYFSTGQDPASYQWRQIKTDRFRLVYPSFFESNAQYLSGIIDLAANHETRTLNARLPRIPVLLHPGSARSNGVTVWAPKRIELYPAPPQDSYAEEWLEQLVIHEYRHAVQISKMNQGFSKVLYYVFGEQITGGILGLYIPTWFLEGDATITETALTRTGRGRSALFESVLRAQVLEKGSYSYDKATMGSYRTFTPDAYELGYFITGAARARYGTELWNEALDRTAKYPFMVVPFNSGIRKITGKWKVPLYKEMIAHLDSGWTTQLTFADTAGLEMVTARDHRSHTNYIRPLVVNDSMLVAGRSSMNDLDRFVMIDLRNGKESVIATPGNYLSGSQCVSGNILSWLDYQTDPRWTHRSFNRIMTMNLTTGRQRVLVSRSRYFSVAQDADGKRMAAIQITENNEFSLVILRLPEGSVVRKFSLPGFQNVANPGWTPDGNHVIFTSITAGGKALARLDLHSGIVTDLFPPTFRDIRGVPTFFNQYILFSADYGGIQDIYAFDTLKQLIFRVTSARFGITDPVVLNRGNQMAVSDYCSDGMMISRVSLDPAQWKPLELVNDYSVKLYEPLAAQEGVNIQDSTRLSGLFSRLHPEVEDDTAKREIQSIYPSRKYNRFTHLFNPHSWAPVSINAANLELNPGVMLLAQNLLSTLFAGAGWEYDIQEQTGNFYTTLRYEGWYPVIAARFDMGNRAGYYTYGMNSGLVRYTWQESKVKVNASVPLNFSRGRNASFLQPSAGVTFIHVKPNESTPENFQSGWITTLDYRLTASHYRRYKGKDLLPSFGFSTELNFRHTPFGENEMGRIAAAEITTWLPGFFRHHGWWFYGGYQKRDEAGSTMYRFGDFISYPRGYIGVLSDEAFSVKGNYKFPVCYPDFSVGSVVYLKRVKLNLFYDAAMEYDSGAQYVFQSAGAELTADFHVLRFIYPVEMGVRAVYDFTVGAWGWEFLYAVSIP